MYWHSEFPPHTTVRRRNNRDGSEPAYRFEGTVCGSYRNPVTGQGGAVVMSFAERGCVQIFPDYMLEESPDAPL